jgi:hypothetical protein
MLQEPKQWITSAKIAGILKLYELLLQLGPAPVPDRVERERQVGQRSELVDPGWPLAHDKTPAPLARTED